MLVQQSQNNKTSGYQNDINNVRPNYLTLSSILDNSLEKVPSPVKQRPYVPMKAKKFKFLGLKDLLLTPEQTEKLARKTRRQKKSPKVVQLK